ncbi:MAG TPA: hypothetical protein PKY08_01450 [Candidatus Magasanikbacteria bacterium]|nr:hypothetical protein [Candidatus Magasanikbacteria bacterium]
MKIKKISLLIFSLVLSLSFIISNICFAQVGMLNAVGDTAGYDQGTDSSYLSVYIGKIIYIILSLLGVIFLALTVYAGFLWFTAGGDEKKVEKAKDYLKNGIIGLLIVLASAGITTFIVGNLVESTLGSGAVDPAQITST